MSQESIPKCLDDAEYLLTYELGARSWRTLLFEDADELREFLRLREYNELVGSFFIRKMVLVDTRAFMAGDNDALEDYVKVTHDG